MTRPAGMTLIELLISMVVLTIIGGVLLSLYLGTLSFTKAEQDRVELDVSANRILATMDETLRQGKQILSEYIDGTTIYTTGDQTLVLALPSLLASGSLSTTYIDTLVFTLEGSTLVLKTWPSAVSTRVASTRTVTADVADLFYRYQAVQPVDATAVTVTLKTSRPSSTTTHSQTSILYVTLRNHP